MKAPTRALFSTCARRTASAQRRGERNPAKHPKQGPDTDLEAEVRVLVHPGEEVGIRALLEEPALALELGRHGLVRLVEQAQPVQARDAGDRAGAQGGQRDHKLADHHPASARHGLVLYNEAPIMKRAGL